MYAAFVGFVLVMLALDLGIFNRKSHVVSFKEAAIWSGVWVVLALFFNGIFYWYASATYGSTAAGTSSLEFLTGYVLEYTLSIDNIFVLSWSSDTLQYRRNTSIACCFSGF